MVIHLFLLLLWVYASIQDCSWNNCNKWSTDKNTITAHLIPHTHDDLGWLKTVDQYYYGSNNRIVPVGVQYIYNTVVDELQKDPTRRFSFAETGFLWRWYSSQHDFEKHKLQKLIKTGQVELIGGGWVQNDEAAAHYVDIIDQMTLGLKKLSILFGECGKPQSAWQIDPFGHSKELANIFALMGYSSLYFARIHYLEKEARLANKSLEFVWNASEDLKTQILTGAFFKDDYGPPDGFCFDRFCEDEPIMDNPDLEEYNVDEKVAAFVKHVKHQASFQRTNHVMLLMGSDFQYSNANQWYTNLDKLIRYVNANASLGVNVIYSTPSCYTKAITEASPHLPSKDDDFFPYASDKHEFWTGYFTSRPTFKGMIRESSSLLQLAKQLDAIADLGPSDDSDVEIMQKASALVQHHDGVTGTAKENVTRDYEKRLAKGMKEAEIVINDFLKVYYPKESGKSIPNQSLCNLVNETKCDVISDLDKFTVTVFNSRTRTMEEIITIPYYSRQGVVQDSNGQPIESQLFKTYQTQLKTSGRAPYELSFNVSVPPLGYRTYFVTNTTTKQSTAVSHPIKAENNDDSSISNNYFTLTFDKSGYLTAIFEKSTNTSHVFRQQFFYYRGTDNSTKERPSGAYMFRPNGTEPIPFNGPARTEFSKGPLYEEVRQTIAPWISQTIRLFIDKPYIEFDWTVGPIPKEVNGSPISKEVITRYFSDIDSGPFFYTDSNGRQMMKRQVNNSASYVYNNTEPISGNYYPITNRVFLKDSHRQLTVLTDRAQGATAVHGMIEIMLHRRTFYDDRFGVEEPLDEPGTDGEGLVAKGKHLLLIGDVESASSIHRPLAVDIFHKPFFTFSAVKDFAALKKNYNLEFSGLTKSLPQFVHMLTLEKWHKRSLLLRFEHIYQDEEDSVSSRPQTVDVRNMFSQFEIVAMNELMLAGNRNATNSRLRPDRKVYDQFAFEIRPQEIRTFEIEVKRKSLQNY